jgi:hypothetical protein
LVPTLHPQAVNDAFARAIRETSRYWLTLDIPPPKPRDDASPKQRDR